MIHVKVELWPGGDRARRKDIAEINIANVSELAEISDYRYSVTRDMDAAQPTLVRGRIVQHRRSAGVLRLVQRVLKDYFGRTGETL